METPNSNGSDGRHPIQVVARRSGLTADVLRAWEKRYAVVRPSRSAGGRRLYSNADIERLTLLREATEAGRRIGDVARMGTADLRQLVREDREARAAAATRSLREAPATPVAQHLDECLAAARGLDAAALEAALERAVVLLSPVALVDDLLAPLMQRIGQSWWEGQLGPGQEHLATAVVQRVLARVTGALHAGGGARKVIVVTPARQRHEIGAGLVAAAAAAHKWQVTYLGADLPADEIAKAAGRVGADAVALSIVHPADDPELGDELRRLRSMLDESVPLIVGGRGAQGYRSVLEDIGAVVLTDLAGFRATLDALAGGRMGPGPGGTNR